ncbi:Cytochrome c oxidase subunit 5A [Mactra antiquata]
MLRSVLARGASVARATSRCQSLKPATVMSTSQAYNSGLPTETGDTSKDFIAQFSRPNVSGYDIRNLVQYMQGLDYVPESAVIDSMLRACRQVNDYALAIRILEAVRWKCGGNTQLYQDLMNGVKATREELGVLTVEEMGYDQPELYLKDVDDM